MVRYSQSFERRTIRDAINGHGVRDVQSNLRGWSRRAQSARSFPPEPASATHVTNGLARVPSPSFTDTSEWAIAEDHLMLKSETAAAGGQTGMSDGCGRLALCAHEEKSPRSGGRCRRSGGVAVYLPGGGRDRLADHDRHHALYGLVPVSGK